ncbi:MAG: radical SAM protein [Candidatus Omnitrophica bacterium]|nr:radical SAM protein [Candidatus Omnitrophota bacterium]
MRDFHIQWHIANRCNLRCIHCYQDDFSSNKELNLDDLIKISDNLIDTMKKWDAYLYLSLTGGEPLLFPYLWDLIDYLNKEKRIYQLSIITNGTLIDINIDKILKSKIKKIFVSLDGTNAKINDYIRGKGVFDKVIRNIKLLKEKKIKVFIMYTLMNYNLKEAEELISFCKSIDVDGFIIERFFPLGFGRKISEQLVSKEDLLSLYKELFKQTGNIFRLDDVIKTRALYLNLENSQIGLYTSECVVGKFGLAILSDGGVLPCRRFTLKIGNLLEQTLDEIWKNSEVLNKIRKKENLKGLCKSCDVKNCIGCRAFVYTLTKDYLAEDKNCFLLS